MKIVRVKRDGSSQLIEYPRAKLVNVPAQRRPQQRRLSLAILRADSEFESRILRRTPTLKSTLDPTPP
jgi:hypothetical protein